jgi:hypothetical protein
MTMTIARINEEDVRPGNLTVKIKDNGICIDARNCPYTRGRGKFLPQKVRDENTEELKSIHIT